MLIVCLASAPNVAFGALTAVAPFEVTCFADDEA